MNCCTCAFCQTKISEDAPYKMYIPFSNGKGTVEKRVCFYCHFCIEYLTGEQGRVSK